VVVCKVPKPKLVGGRGSHLHPGWGWVSENDSWSLMLTWQGSPHVAPPQPPGFFGLLLAVEKNGG
jgi:hypothetical protein